MARAAPAQHCQAAPAWRILESVRAQLFGGRQTRSGANGKENTGGERQWWSSKRAPGTGDSAWEPPLPRSSAPSQVGCWHRDHEEKAEPPLNPAENDGEEKIYREGK